MEFYIGSNTSWSQNNRLKRWNVGFHMIVVESVENYFKDFKFGLTNAHCSMIETKI